MKIILKDYEVIACHGVNAEEKVNPQRFLFTAEIDADCTKASKMDDIDSTVSYSAVKKLIKAFAEGHCFNLIEALADGAAKLILDSFPLAEGVKVTVKKPDAPMSGNFKYVAVVAERKWHRVYLSLGSSMGDKAAYLDFGVKGIADIAGIRGVRESKRFYTLPYGGVALGQFLNSAVECYSYLTPSELLEEVNAVESAAGRVRDKRWDDRTLDIDILLYGDEVIDKNGLLIPHVDMINREFVLEPLVDLNPHAIHPILKRTALELLENLQARIDNH